MRYHWQRYGSGEAENEDAKRSEREQNEQLGEGRVIERGKQIKRSHFILQYSNKT